MGSSPIIIRIGSDTAEPDDATVLRNPQTSPAKRSESEHLQRERRDIEHA